MNKSAEPAPSQARTLQSDSKRRETRTAQAAGPKSGHLAQLATLMNESPRVQALTAMSAWMNPNPADTAPAQLAASPIEAPIEDGLPGSVEAEGENLSSPSPTPNVVQRKIMVNGADYAAKPESSQAIQDAASDEFLRYYQTEQEVTDHLDTKAPTPFGLIEQRALWYRIPFLSQNFFVFGESHAAVRGGRIKEESNIQKPILDESLTGWSVGQEDTGGGHAGADENSSKLLRALEAWNIPKPAAGGAAGVQPAPGPAPVPGPPTIPEGKASTRDTARGTYRLVVYDESGQEAWWKPSGQAAAPQSTHNLGGEVLAAIRALFALIFEDEIDKGKLNQFGDKVSTAWQYFQAKSWLTLDAQPAYNMQMTIRNKLYTATRAKVYEAYKTLRDTHADVTKAEDKANWTADDYRNEFMFVRILKAAEQGAYAFATIGDKHLLALKDRLAEKNIPFVTMEDFFGRYSRDAVDTHAIAHANSPAFRKNERMVLWFRAAWTAYPNVQQEHLNMLNAADMGEFVLTGKVSKWERPGDEAAPGEHHKPVLYRLLNDLKKEYPNSDDFISALSLDQIGEFLTTGKIAAWA